VDAEENGTCSDPRKGLLWVVRDMKGKILICPANGWWDAGSLELARSCGRQIVNDRAAGVIEMVSEWPGTRYYLWVGEGGAKDFDIEPVSGGHYRK